MQKTKQSSRRKFLKELTGTTLAISAAPLASFATQAKKEEYILQYQKNFSSNDQINVAAIGMGIMGNHNVEAALKVPGVQLVAACDLYTGRLERTKELHGKDLFVTNDYRKILERKDIDAVIISTCDQWHARITKAALRAGKHVYCEKPMVHYISEGLDVIKVQKESGKVMQVGSQYVSNIVFQKAHELYKSGEIGKLNMVNAVYDRQDALGAWEYTMPTDGSTKTVDWDRYIEGMKKIPYDPKKFFWWRNYREFGTGVAGDLFVHLLSGTHLITDSKGPEKIYASGQLCYWKDGRNVPDVMEGIMQYPETIEHSPFQLTLQVNFVSGTGGSEVTRFVGDEGTITISPDALTVHHSKMPEAPGIGGWDALFTYPEAMQKLLVKQYNEKYTPEQQARHNKPDLVYKAPPGYDAHLQHHINFFNSVRNGTPVVEDAVFGFRAAAPALACNESYFENKIIHWDPINMKKIES
ncbi:MAG TPA: Gfo/Idh/MocA family oxidoreductase [Hanamia sp.]|nr:Gfo/Idh/MocA family oxidoreductase [Hanamia sp.]